MEVALLLSFFNRLSSRTPCFLLTPVSSQFEASFKADKGLGVGKVWGPDMTGTKAGSTINRQVSIQSVPSSG